jgi:fumarate reductase flavoprotein subunit
MGISGDEEFFVVADSIEELADRLGIAQETLKATIEEYNQFCATGRDTQFGKAPRYLLPLTGKRFYACKFYPSGYGSLGGLKTDDSLRVVRPDGTPIDGLFSAGTDCCSIFGDTYMFYFPGSTMGFAINSGRMAGMNAVDFIDSYDFEEPLE